MHMSIIHQKKEGIKVKSEQNEIAEENPENVTDNVDWYSETTNGENLESTILTSHSSPDKANRPRASSLRSKTRFHDYVAEEHRYPPVNIKKLQSTQRS